MSNRTGIQKRTSNPVSVAVAFRSSALNGSVAAPNWRSRTVELQLASPE